MTLAFTGVYTPVLAQESEGADEIVWAQETAAGADEADGEEEYAGAEEGVAATDDTAGFDEPAAISWTEDEPAGAEDLSGAEQDEVIAADLSIDADDGISFEEASDEAEQEVSAEENGNVSADQDGSADADDSVYEAGAEEALEALLGNEDDWKNTIYAFPTEESIFVLTYNEENAYVAAISENGFKAYAGQTVSGGVVNRETDLEIFYETLPSGQGAPLTQDVGYYVLASKTPAITLDESNIIKYDENTELFHLYKPEDPLMPAPADAASLIGPQEIGFTGQVLKNNSVKFKWGASAGSKKYKSFQLFRMKKDGSWSELSSKSSKKGYTLGAAQFQQFDGEYTDVFKLVCDDADSYVTTVTPSILDVETYYGENSLRFTHTALSSGEYMDYVMEVADDKAFTKSVSDNNSSTYNYEMDYPLTRKLSTKSVYSIYYQSDRILSEGSTVYCRMKTSFTLGGRTFFSNPGPTRAVKVGPRMCSFLGFTGVTPSGEVLNPDTYLPTPGEAYAIFTGPARSSVAGYELLVSDKPGGKYKTLKKFPASAAETYNPPQLELGEGEESNLMYIKYVGLSPVEKYYSIRAISKVKKAPGGYERGTTGRSGYRKVEGAEASSSDPTSITVSFKSDLGVNEYWIYRDTVSANVTGTIKKAALVGKVKNKYKKKNAGQELKFVDKKDITDGVDYYYTVRPVFSAANAKTQEEEESKIDDGTPAEYTYSLSDPVSGKATMANVTVKNVKASVLNVKQVRVTWGKTKGAKMYYIFYGTRGSDGKISAEFVTSVDASQRKYDCEVAVPGKEYIFGVSVGGENTDSDYWTITNKLATTVSIPTKLSAGYYSSGNTGAKLTWTNPSEDKDYAGSITYYVDYKDNSGSWNNLGSVKATSSSMKDDIKLTRGNDRAYRMYAVYEGVANGQKIRVASKKYTSTVHFCKPERISVTNSSKSSVRSIAMDAGTSVTLRVYFYDRHDDYDTVTDKKLESIKFIDDTAGCTCTQGKEGDYVTLKISAKKKGSADLKVRARDYDDYSGGLSKTISITVRE